MEKELEIIKHCLSNIFSEGREFTPEEIRKLTHIGAVTLLCVTNEVKQEDSDCAITGGEIGNSPFIFATGEKVVNDIKNHLKEKLVDSGMNKEAEILSGEKKNLI